MPARKSISDAEKCREALPMVSDAVRDMQGARRYCREDKSDHARFYISNAIIKLEQARKALSQ